MSLQKNIRAFNRINESRDPIYSQRKKETSTEQSLSTSRNGIQSTCDTLTRYASGLSYRESSPSEVRTEVTTGNLHVPSLPRGLPQIFNEPYFSLEFFSLFL